MCTILLIGLIYLALAFLPKKERTKNEISMESLYCNQIVHETFFIHNSFFTTINKLCEITTREHKFRR